MRLQPRHALLFAIILIEGYVVLAAELLAIRLLLPYVGSGVEVVAIIISGVLLPLAAGYHAGGRRYRHPASIRRLLLRNMLGASLGLVFGLSFLFIGVWFEWLGTLGAHHPLLLTALYAACFLVYPIFLLAQTVPLISNYFAHQRLSHMTGRMLFFSTLGSFMGSVFSTLVLMNLIGVHLTALATMALLLVAILLLARRTLCYETGVGAALIALMVAMNAPGMMAHLGLVSDNAYNTAMVKPTPNEPAKELSLNFSRSSKFSSIPDFRYPYIRFIEETAIESMPSGKPKEILVIGAGGFTLGWDDRHNHYRFVDIDPDLKRISEQHLLPEPLPETKKFIAQSARSYLVQEQPQRFDLVVVDVYSNQDSIPMEVTTVEFWQQIKARLKPDGVLIANVIMSPMFRDRYSARAINTFSAVFPHHLRQVPYDFSTWDKGRADNVLLIARHSRAGDDTVFYTDDKSSYSLDRYRKR